MTEIDPTSAGPAKGDVGSTGVPPPPPELDQEPPHPGSGEPGAAGGAPQYSPEEIANAGGMLGAVVVMGIAAGFQFSGSTRTVNEKQSDAIRASAMRYAHARPNWVVPATRYLPEVDFFGSILAVVLLEATDQEKTDGGEAPIPGTVVGGA